jgi:hypothetical protein
MMSHSLEGLSSFRTQVNGTGGGESDDEESGDKAQGFTSVMDRVDQLIVDQLGVLDTTFEDHTLAFQLAMDAVERNLGGRGLLDHTLFRVTRLPTTATTTTTTTPSPFELLPAVEEVGFVPIVPAPPSNSVFEEGGPFGDANDGFTTPPTMPEPSVCPGAPERPTREW